MSVSRLCPLHSKKKKEEKEKKKKKRRGNRKYLLTRFQQRFREGLPGLIPGSLLGSRIASLWLLVAPDPNPLARTANLTWRSS